MALLTVRDLRKTFAAPRGPWGASAESAPALVGVSFDIDAKEAVAMVGGSGSGKSTLARILSGLLEPDSGSVTWNGEPLLALPRRERARRIQMIFQDPYASLNPKLSVETQLGEAISQTASAGESSRTRTERCAALLESVGLAADALRQYPFQFSGGQRQRIAIARALALNPQMLIADEPLSSLDVLVQAQILELVRSLRRRLGLTLLLITHDLAVAAQEADHILVLEQGALVEQGPASSVVQSPQQPYTRSLLNALPRPPC